MAKTLLGTCEEALSFLTNPVTGWLALTDLKALIEVCQQVSGTASLADIAGTDLELKASMVLAAIEFAHPLPKEYSASWRGWLDAFMADDPEIEILLLEEAIITHQVPADARSDIDPSIITSAMS